MSAGLESGCHNHIDTGCLQGDGLVPGRGGADRADALATTLFKNLLRNAVDEREGRHLSIEQNAHLIFEAKRLIRGAVKPCPSGRGYKAP